MIAVVSAPVGVVSTTTAVGVAGDWVDDGAVAPEEDNKDMDSYWIFNKF